MTLHRPPPLVRLKRRARRTLTASINLARSAICTSDVLLATGNSEPAKVAEIESRLQYLFAHLDRAPDVRFTDRATAVDYLRHTAVAVADSNTISAGTRRYLRWVFDVDYDNNQDDGWALIDLAAALTPRHKQQEATQAARVRFLEHVRSLQSGGPRPAYLFGTGPSLQLAKERDFADGITVVCNTIVRDTDLFHHLAPAFLAAGDAIYHFGHNPHAESFRIDARRRLQESDGRTLFVYPAPFDVIVRSEFRGLEALLVPIPLGDHFDISGDLTKNFRLPDVQNVLPLLLLPVGCTLSKDVRFWGFDGRSPSDTGFWANSDRHSYPELMQSIREAHPAFFAQKTPVGNEIQYANQVHGDLLDRRLAEAETRGFEFRMLHQSWTPTLAKRYRRDC